MTPPAKTGPAQAAELLRQLDNVLIVTHVRPDGDAIGSALGLGALMRANMRRAKVLLPEPIPEKYEELTRNTDFLTALPPDGLQQFQALIALDCSRGDRVAMGKDHPFPPEGLPVFNIDHHADNSVQAKWSCVIPDAAATSEILVRLAAGTGWKMTPLAATCFLLGIMTDTGSFRFSNTTAETLRSAASLLENDAAQAKIVNAVYFSKPRDQQRFEADMMQNHCTVEFDGAYAWAALPEELFRKYSFSMRNGEMLIELLREIKGVRIAALLYPAGDQVKISLRSKDPQYPVGPLARKLGGGGHEMAAGITLNGTTLEAAAKILREEVGRLL